MIQPSSATPRPPLEHSPRSPWREGRLPRTIPRAVAAATVAVLILAGCSTLPSAHSAGAPSSRALVSESGSAGEATTSAVPVPHDRAASAAPTRADGVGLAVEATRLFCRPRVSRARWIGDLDRVLTLEAAAVYATVDPARVQCSRVGQPAQAGEGDRFTQLVTVPTNTSPCRVFLSRTSLSAPWLVFRITPTGTR